jgi:non-ribosomal peptide synthase protein (TIGR01720 family)
VVFNYLGQWDARSQGSGETSPDGSGSAGPGLYLGSHPPLGQEHDPAEPSGHALEVVGAAEDGRLEFAWYYRPDRYDKEAVAAIAGDFIEALRRIARQCREIAS